MDATGSNAATWTYVGYEKMPESANQWQLTETEYRIFKKTDWVVTEKIHGANFGIVTDGREVRFAKRKEFLEPGSDFFGYLSLKEKLADQVKEIFRLLHSSSSLEKVYVYGELFGGEYPHPDVPVCDDVQAVQTGVYYSPRIEYCAFDIAVFKGGSRIYLDYDRALQLFQQVGMLGAAPLFVGKYEDAIAFNVEFESTLPRVLGLPELQGENKAEGIVVKPVKAIYIDTRKGKVRPVIKKKIAEFAEDSRYHQAKKWDFKKPAVLDREISIESELSGEMLALVTPTRLNNVISKVGRLAAKEELVALLYQDVLSSFYEEYESIFCLLSGDIQENMMQQLYRAVEREVG